MPGPATLTQVLTAVWTWADVVGIADPGDGYLQADDPVTTLCISSKDQGGTDRLAELFALVPGDGLILQLNADASQWLDFVIVGYPVEHPSSGAGSPRPSTVSWAEVPVEFAGGSMATQPRRGDELFVIGDHREGAPTGNIYATPAQLAHALHMRYPTTDIEKDAALQRAIASSSAEIDQELNRVYPLPDPVPDLIVQTCINRAVEWFKAADAAFGIVGVEDTGVVRTPKDSFARHAQNIQPYKQQWGLA